VRATLPRLHRESLLPLLAAIAYLAVAMTACPVALPERGSGAESAHSVASHDGSPDGSPSLTAPCECGCEHVTGSVGFGKRLEPGIAPEPPPPLARASASICEVASRLPDAPIFREAPVPIPA